MNTKTLIFAVILACGCGPDDGNGTDAQVTPDIKTDSLVKHDLGTDTLAKTDLATDGMQEPDGLTQDMGTDAMADCGTPDTQNLCLGVNCNTPNGACNPLNGKCLCKNAGLDPAQNCGACLPGFKNYPTCDSDKCLNVSCPDNGDKCDGAEVCDPATGACIHLNPITCQQDGDVCNGVETCNKTTGLCPSLNPLVCDDGKKCNGQETCDKVTGCKPGTPLVCGNGDVCDGIETCDDAVGCKPGTPLVCNDNKACNGVETCDKTAGCKPGTIVTCSGFSSCTEPAGTCTCNSGFGPLYPTCNNLACYGSNGQLCSGQGSCNQSAGYCVCNNTGQDPNTDCGTCKAGYINWPTCSADPCAGITCQHGGTCSGGTCTCTNKWTGPTCATCPANYGGTDCNACAVGFGPAYPTCNPVPTITGLAIDCSIDGGYCSGGGTYPVTWNFTNATTFSTTLTKISGCTPTNGVLSPSSGTLTGTSQTINYTLGSCGPSMVRITVTVTGPGGQANSLIDVDYN